MYLLKISLAATLHNQNDEMLPIVEKTIRKQKKLFSSINITATANTHKKLINYLVHHINLKTTPNRPRGSSANRKLALKMAVKVRPQARAFFHIDYDRFLHWLSAYPQELENFLRNLPTNYDFLSIGRTKRAFLTHPKIQIEAERWTNKKLKKILNVDIDTTTGCYLISKKLAGIISKRGGQDNLLSVTDGEWPALAFINNLSLGRVDVEGLEFETPDFHRKDIKKAGSKQKWIKKVYESAKMKKFRWKIAKETVKAAREIISRGLEQ